MPDEPSSHAATSDDFAATRRELATAAHAPGFIYYSKEQVRLEKERIFTKEWLCVGRVEEIAAPHDYMALRIAGEPILLTRNSAGEIGCFANLCLHRGVELASGSGNAATLSCPYHAWTYDLDGQLLGAAFMSESRGFDPKRCRLKPIHAGVWVGWIFINMSADPAPLSTHLEDFANDVGCLRMEDCRIGGKLVLDVSANWKFAVENVMDVYHTRTLHHNSFGKHRGRPENYPFRLRKNGGTCTVYEAAPKTPEGKTLFRKMPALKDHPDNFATSCHLAPNMQVTARMDAVQVLISWPVTETTSRMIVYNLFPAEFHELPDFATRVKVYDDYARLFLGEDAAMMDSLQKAMQSESYVPGRFSTLEAGIHHVLNDYLDRLYDRSAAR
jgi:choline monooxygenase